MREELSQIDLSPLAELVRIKREEEILAERLVKIEDRADKVSRTVYDRVKRDYETRKASLEQESRPLKEKARAEYRRLDVLRLEVEKSVEAAALDKEELELRKDLGEFPDKEYKERLADCEKKLNGERQDLEEVGRTKAKFLEAFHSEGELAAGPPPPPPPPAPVRSVSATFVPPSADATVIGASSQAPPAAEAGATVIGSAPEPESPDATVIQASRPGAESTATGREPTRALPRARLALLDGESVEREFPVKPGTSTIGRLAQSDIHLPTPDVSRRHAQIVFGTDGCFVVDLGSENGVVVNGARVAKHKLADGDVIQLGKQRLRFLD
jgi:hypothetical protein